MAKGDVLLFKDPSFGSIGSSPAQVAAGTTASINAGELVLKALGSAFVTAWTANNAAKPVVGTDYIAGISASDSNETASAAGSVEVIPLVPGQQFLISPTAPTSWDTQAEYDALVGDRVLLNTTAGGVQTILAADGATNGLVVQQLDITKYPGKVAFAIRAGANYLA